MKKTLGWTIGILVVVLYVKFALLSHADSCEALAAGVQETISEAQQCSTDSDCGFIRLSCPFPCITASRKEAQSDIFAAVSTYHDSCMPLCPDCPKHTPQKISCLEGICVAH